MIKVLRKRFILTAMIAVAVLLVLMFGNLNVMNYIAMNNNSDKVLEKLAVIYNSNPLLMLGPADEEGSDEKTDAAQDIPAANSTGNSVDQGQDSSASELPDELLGKMREEPGNIGDVTPLTIDLGLIEPDLNLNDLLRGTYYTVEIDPESGEVGYTDVTHVADVTAQQARENALQLFAQNRSSGWYGHCKFLKSSGSNENIVYIFLDRQPELINVNRIMLFSVFILVVFFGIFMLLVFLISNKMLKPVADNIEQQKNFVTNAGHEIKTPLAIIQANTEALELHNGENKWTSNIKDQISRLSILMNNMLTLAKAQEGVTSQPKADIDLSSLLRDFMRMFTESAVQKNVTISGKVEDAVIISGVRVQVGQVISIILDNAVKYCAPDSNIDISLTAWDKNVCLKEANICTALPECEPERLFERFYRPDVTRYSETSGNGIGLSAARAIMESLGGSISCAYIGDNKIEFTLIFRK